MEYLRISRKFSFEAAHALLGYDGACRHIHGHSYKLEVGLIGPVRQQPEHPKDGMVLDFGELKKLVQKQVIEVFDHALLLNKNSPSWLLERLKLNDHKLLLLPCQPTCENMLLDIKCRILAELPKSYQLCRLLLSETENAFAEWYAEDNPATARQEKEHAYS